MVTSDCSLGWSASMRGWLASTEGWSGCNLETMAMAGMVTWAGRSGLMGCNSDSGPHGQDSVYKGSKQERIQRGSFHLRRWHQKVRIRDHQGSCLSP